MNSNLRHYFLAGIFFIILLGLVTISNFEIFADKPNNIGKPNFIISVEELKEEKFFKKDEKITLQSQTFIFYKNDDAKGGNSDKTKQGKSRGCFQEISNGLRWKTTENYVVNPTRSDSSIDNELPSDASQSIHTWDSEVSFQIFGNGETDNNVVPILDEADDNNVIAYGTIIDEKTGEPSQNIIASTRIFFEISGLSPKDKEIVSWDIILNDATFVFGNAGVTSETNLGELVMDRKNILTHELGHSAGLTHPNDICTEETMFAGAELGETKKRTLNLGDIQGINHIY